MTRKPCYLILTTLVAFTGLLRCQVALAVELMVGGSVGADGGFHAFDMTGHLYDGTSAFPFAPPNTAPLFSIASSNEVEGVAISGQDLFAAGVITNSISEFDSSGALINATLITGLSTPSGIAVSGNDIFVANYGNGTIGEYTTSGAVVNASLITGLAGPYGIAVSGGNLFIGEYTTGTISEYTTSGALVNPSLITGLDGPGFFSISGNDIFVPNFYNGTVGEYTTSGDVINAALVMGAHAASGVAVVGDNLFVTTGFGSPADGYTAGGVIEEFTMSGALVNGSLLAPHVFAGVRDIVVVPEPASVALFSMGAVAMFFIHMIARRHRLR